MWETKFIILLKPNKIDNISFTLPKLQINNQLNERADSITSSSVLLDKCLSWKKHIKYIEWKVSKNISFLFKAKTFVNQSSLLALCCLYIHSY